jgi:murein DD-endopeptidase MepM/ murein hydrolase activator NlpD
VKLLLLFLLFTQYSFSAPNSKLSNFSLKKMRNDLAKYDTKLSSLKAEINSLDKRIGTKNGSYISKLEKIKSIENTVMSIDEQLIDNVDIIKEKKRKAKIFLEKIYVNSIDHDEEGEYLYRKEIYSKALIKETNELESTLKRSNEFHKSLDNLKKSLVKIREDEQILYQVILQLENEKKQIAEIYIGNENKKTHLEKKIEANQLKKKLTKLKKSKKIATTFKLASPLDSFIDYKAGKKGITYTFKTTMPVKSAAEGKVVYTGELSRYGNVVMVDHGKNIKTVFLGDMTVKVKKGDFLKTGDVLGYTRKSKKDEEKNLYFEVRKKNKAQNTVLWLDKKSIVKI